jgi:hypothetical protein
VRVVVLVLEVGLVYVLVRMGLMAMRMLMDHMVVLMAEVGVLVQGVSMCVLVVVRCVVDVVFRHWLYSLSGVASGVDPLGEWPSPPVVTWSMWRSASSSSEATWESKSP